MGHLGYVLLSLARLTCYNIVEKIIAYLSVANVGDGWFALTEKSDYIQAIGLSSAKFQHSPHAPSRKPMAASLFIGFLNPNV